jgi:hypothetical protein
VSIGDSYVATWNKGNSTFRSAVSQPDSLGFRGLTGTNILSYRTLSGLKQQHSTLFTPLPIVYLALIHLSSASSSQPSHANSMAGPINWSQPFLPSRHVGEWRSASNILDLGNIFVTFTPRPFYSVNTKLGGSWSHPGHGDEKHFHLHRESNPDPLAVQPIAQSPYRLKPAGSISSSK